MAIVRERVFPDRQKMKGGYARIWWQYGRRQEKLYEAIAPLTKVLAISQVSKYLAFVFVPKGYVYAMMTIIVASDEWCDFALLSSSVHEVLVRKYASTLETLLRYTPTDCFETFPFPTDLRGLETIGEQYHEYRRQIMLARQEGLTATYNRFHNPDEHSADIVRLRELHVEMDRAVAAAYGWQDINLGHGFHQTAQGIRFTISEDARREVLARLLKLNHERYEEEVRMGLHSKKAKGTLRKRKVEGKKGKETGSAGDKGKKTRKVKENGEDYGARLFE